EQCQLYYRFGHSTARKFDLFNAPCNVPNCKEIMLLYSAHDYGDKSKNVKFKFLKCQYDECPGYIELQPQPNPIFDTYSIPK
ncbi:hypothetical protein FRX31_012952, partial [Thalictrum thalictroides]